MKNIKTSDLRLGNWLYYTNETKFLMQVVAIGDDWVQLDFEGNDGDSFEINGNEICPIPITKEFVKHIANNVQDVEELCLDRKSTRLNSSHSAKSRMPSSA